MADRDRIDWQNLAPLARKRMGGATVDDLAARKFNMGKAKHKGRCHTTNQKRRQIAKEIETVRAKENAKTLASYRAHKARVRAFWTGDADEHP